MTAASLLASSPAIAAPAPTKKSATTTGGATTGGATTGGAATTTAAPAPTDAPAAGTSAPNPTSPDALSDEAIARFKAKDYEGAVDYFERAYAVDPKPNYLFNIGRVYEEAGQLPEAVRFYERFLREPGVDLESREIALQRLRLLRAIIAETTPKEPPKVEPAPEPATEPERVATPPPEPAPEGPPPRVRKLRIAGYSLMGLGGAGLILGAAFGGIASKQARDLETTDGYDARQELIRVGQNNAKIADIAMISGGALALTGLVLVLVTLKGRSRPASSAASSLIPTVGRGELGLALGGRF